MIFAELPLEQCEGALLVHAQRCGDRLFKKGRRLSAADVEALHAEGAKTLAVARLEAGDVPEDAAAAELGKAVAGAGIHIDPAFTGRANLHAESDGVLLLDPARVDALNEIDEAITLATLPPFAAVKAGQLVATVKIIPFAVDRADLDACIAIAKDGAALLAAAKYRARSVALIQTELPNLKASVMEKTVAVLNARLAELGNPPAVDLRCHHDQAALSVTLAKARQSGAELILILGASAITDRRDVIPAAILGAGGKIDQFGMPVDPGNLLLLGEIDGRKAIGLPGCARSPKLNGFDWVLQRVMADLPVTAKDIRHMGVGGLLSEIPSRPQPRSVPLLEAAGRPKIAAVILAAGKSSRMGRNKLLLDFRGKPILDHVADQTAAAGISDIVVVCGHQAGKVRAALADRKLKVVEARDYQLGMSASLKAGIRALPPGTDAMLVLLGDMPQVSPELIKRLIAAYNPLEGRAIVLPSHQGKRGNPVLFDRRFFPEMLELEGDVGARHLIGLHEDLVCDLAVDTAGVFADVDTPDAYDQLLAGVTG